MGTDPELEKMFCGLKLVLRNSGGDVRLLVSVESSTAVSYRAFIHSDIDWSVQKIVEEYILQMDLTEGDRADLQHILHRDFHLHVYFKEMVQLTTIEVKIQEIWNSTNGHLFKLLMAIIVCL